MKNMSVDCLDRRSGVDRRSQQRGGWRYWLSGRRSVPRRRDDRRKAYRLDRYSVRTLVLILGLILLSVTDAVLTLHLISHGARELNPVLRYFLQHGPLAFFLAKYLLTCLPVFLIILNQNAFLFRSRFRVKTLYILFLLPFVVVIHWQLYLVLFVI